MLFKKWVQSYFNDDIDRKMSDKFKKMEKKIDLLEEELKNTQSPIIIDHISIEQIHLDKLEFNNNFGSLGIKELKGKLNIGANYGDKVPLDSFLDKSVFKHKNEQVGKEHEPPPHKPSKPKVTIKTKTD